MQTAHGATPRLHCEAQSGSGKASNGGARADANPICARYLQTLGHYGTIYAQALPGSGALNHWAAPVCFAEKGADASLVVNDVRQQEMSHSRVCEKVRTGSPKTQTAFG
jgi:hypothetical protein